MERLVILVIFVASSGPIIRFYCHKPNKKPEDPGFVWVVSLKLRAPISTLAALVYHIASITVDVDVIWIIKRGEYF